MNKRAEAALAGIKKEKVWCKQTRTHEFTLNAYVHVYFKFINETVLFPEPTSICCKCGRHQVCISPQRNLGMTWCKCEFMNLFAIFFLFFMIWFVVQLCSSDSEDETLSHGKSRVSICAPINIGFPRLHEYLFYAV